MIESILLTFLQVFFVGVSSLHVIHADVIVYIELFP